MTIMSEQNIISEKQQLVMESGKQQPPIADVESQSTTTPPPARPAFLLLWLLFVLGTVGTIVSSNWNKPDFPIHATNILVKSSATTTGTPLPTSAPTSTCDHLTLRREWRNFKPSEQSKYKTALRCLADLPSKNGNGNRLSDFLSAYHYSGWHTSQTSNYLLWNRWYLHNLETALRSQCGYTGDMAYLDWTIPAPEAQAEKEVAATYTSQTTLRETRASKQHLDARIEAAILAAADYDDFVHRLEMRITDLAPFDFSNPDLPLDPLFLHQAQVDRLWWLWRQRHATAKPDIEDEHVRVRGFRPVAAAKDVVVTESAELCYRYV